MCTESLGNSHPLANRDRSEFLLTGGLIRLINKIDKLIAIMSHQDMHSMHYPPISYLEHVYIEGSFYDSVRMDPKCKHRDGARGQNLGHFCKMIL